ncbi:MAG TPA: hypothetical protein ENN76_03300 [Euryarchaeota archaeon]|nr:hypothetical protein [Euryarchaeota archaeon]
MTLRIRVKNAETGATVDMDVEPENSVSEVIESSAAFWDKEAGAYVLRRGKTILRGSETLAQSGVVDQDILELIPDPEGGF